VVAVSYIEVKFMNDKLSSFQNGIMYRHLQRYTLAMIQLWLKEENGVSVCQSAISRSIHRSLMQRTINFRPVQDDQCKYYREKIDARLQRKKYKRHLNKFLGVIEYYRYRLELSPRIIRDKLIALGVETSISSVYRALRLIDEREKIEGVTDVNKNVCQPENPSSGIKQGNVQLQSNSRFGNIPQL
jgi:hypothetical protein